MTQTLRDRYSRRAFLWAMAIGGLAGFIGLGGGEFRLPVLTQVIGFPIRVAIPLNLLISLATLAFALVVRNHAVPVSGVMVHLPEVAGLAIGGVFAAIYGAGLVTRLSHRRLSASIAGLLAALGVLLLFEAFVPLDGGAIAMDSVLTRIACGVLIGLLVGIVSSMLGVAGGELLIPVLVLVFRADIRLAGTASLLIALPIVSTGLWRYYRSGALLMTGGALRVAASMSAGSVIGAALGGLAVAIAPATVLKIVLGSVLLATAVKTVRHGR